MKESCAKEAVEKVLGPLNSRINGTRDWDICVHNPSIYSRILAGGSIALGESYMDGWWSCKALDQFFDRILRAYLDEQIKKEWDVLWAALKSNNWDNIKDLYDERFYRMWTYYLLSCAGSFRSRRNQLWQIVFSRKGIRGGFQYANRI